MTKPRIQRKATQPRLVELVRLIWVAMLGTAGFEVATHLGADTAAKTVLGVFLGAAIGYVIGGVLGRSTQTAVSGLERELRRTPGPEMATGVAGLLVGLIVAFLVSFPLLRLPPGAAWPAIAFVYIVMSTLGYRVGRSRYEELLRLFGLKPRVAGAGHSDISVIDTSALIDGRISDLVATGFLSGSLLVHNGVLSELQTIADSSDDKRRVRGRRGLDVLRALQRDPHVQVALVDEEGVTDVDAALVRLAKERGAALVTVDANLAKVADATSVRVRSVNALASALHTQFAAGEEIVVRMTKEGREHGQGVGYLDDGTMVVVEDASELLGNDVKVRITNTLQTTNGRMVFATLAGTGES
ncbi:MAG: TRAM domain-containing protein [Actinomycetota bacterium]